MVYSKIKYIALVFSMLLLASCAYQNEYASVSRAGTNEEKYDFAIKAYNKQDYKKAIELFESMVNTNRGRDILEGVLYNLSYAYFYEEDYFMAAHYFRGLSRQFPNSIYLEESLYMGAYCKALESTHYQLDQTATYEAIKQLQLFINYYPNSKRMPEVNKIIAELRAKLALKAYKIAEMYYKRSLYNAASIAYSNFLKDYPESIYREEAMFMHLKSRYLYAKNSISSKRKERYEEVLESYDAFMRSYADSEHIKEIEKVKNEVKSKI